MNEIANIAKANNLLVIEDSAQSVGAELDGRKRGGGSSGLPLVSAQTSPAMFCGGHTEFSA